MSQPYFTQYNSFFAYAPNDTAVVSCQGISVNVSGLVVINAGLGGPDVTLQVNAGTILPIVLNQGIIKATGTTATGVTIWS